MGGGIVAGADPGGAHAFGEAPRKFFGYAALHQKAVGPGWRRRDFPIEPNGFLGEPAEEFGSIGDFARRVGEPSTDQRKLSPNRRSAVRFLAASIPPGTWAHASTRALSMWVISIGVRPERHPLASAHEGFGGYRNLIDASSPAVAHGSSPKRPKTVVSAAWREPRLPVDPVKGHHTVRRQANEAVVTC